METLRTQETNTASPIFQTQCSNGNNPPDDPPPCTVPFPDPEFDPPNSYLESSLPKEISLIRRSMADVEMVVDAKAVKHYCDSAFAADREKQREREKQRQNVLREKLLAIVGNENDLEDVLAIANGIPCSAIAKKRNRHRTTISRQNMKIRERIRAMGRHHF